MWLEQEIMVNGENAPSRPPKYPVQLLLENFRTWIMSSFSCSPYSPSLSFLQFMY